ncbi:MAG: hypothetical protein JSU73_11880 [candidate division WOR-3 bacterium]|nr:MAG: hypothetical protein JSU73_11880 [candidate division WOR-3 bacterium]
MYEPDYEDFEHEERPRDEKIDEARDVLLRFFRENREGVYYTRQLQVRFEKQFFHWITGKALNELVGGEVREKRMELKSGARVRFLFHKGNRYHTRQAKKMLSVIQEYSLPDNAIAAGMQAELLFFTALAEAGFMAHGRNVNHFGGKKWTETKHDLDFILAKDDLVYGCEVKNALDYIPGRELEVKLRMCAFLGVKPLFIMRMSPKSYNNMVIEAGGYVMIFEAQVHPVSSRALVASMREVLSLPVDAPRAIPGGIIQRFLKWHRSRCNCEFCGDSHLAWA